MQSLSFDRRDATRLRLLCIGAHADDIEIGCGGTLLTLLRRHPGTHVTWVVFGARGARADEARASAAEFLAEAGTHEIRVLDFEESFFPHHGAEIKRAFETLKEAQPDVIFNHTRHDLHQDHRLLAELGWNTFRDHLVLEYEIPKYDGDLGQPGVFVPLDAAVCRRKCELLRKHFATQRDRHWFDDELFLALLRVRGMECRAPGGYAEAFHGRKLVIG